MGLDRNGVRFLLYARSVGADFTDFAMIGRQGLHLGETELGQALRDHGLDGGVDIFRDMPQQSNYVQGWKREPDQRSRISGTALSRRIYKPIERRVKKLVRLFVSGFDPRFFEPFDPRRGA